VTRVRADRIGLDTDAFACRASEASDDLRCRPGRTPSLARSMTGNPLWIPSEGRHGGLTCSSRNAGVRPAIPSGHQAWTTLASSSLHSGDVRAEPKPPQDALTRWTPN